jgi:ribosome-associated heat shock protein Hsp15
VGGEPGDKLRLDKWLWQARFFKTRTLAARQVSGGHVRVNGTRVSKPAYAVVPGDVLTFVQGVQVRVVRVTALGQRRGPATEAQMLYDDMTEPAEPSESNPKHDGKGRPDKRDRRALERMRRQMPE